MRTASLAILLAIAGSRVLALGSPGEQVQVGSLELEAEWIDPRPAGTAPGLHVDDGWQDRP